MGRRCAGARSERRKPRLAGLSAFWERSVWVESVPAYETGTT